MVSVLKKLSSWWTWTEGIYLRWPLSLQTVIAVFHSTVLIKHQFCPGAEYLGMNKNGGLCPPGAYTVVDFSDLIQAGKNTSR